MTTSTTTQWRQLPSLVAPQYFSGQLLSDADLEDLVEWARARLSLGGRRDGYGVVSGLELRVDPRPGHEAELIVGPGYAVAPGGQDIVVVRDDTVSVSDVDLPIRDDPQARYRVDVYVAPAQAQERPQPGFDVGDPIDKPGARYSRVREGYNLTAEHPRASDPDRADMERFEDAYRRCLSPLREFDDFVGENNPNADAIRKWLGERLRATEFRFAADELAGASHEELRDGRAAVHALFWLVQHRRNAFLAAFAPADDRIRVGRVWISASETGGARTIVAVDAHPPHRRRMSAHRLPAPAGHFNATQLIWERPSVAHLLLAERGINCGDPRRFDPPHRREEFDGIRGAVDLRPGDHVSLLVYGHRHFGWRVVGVIRRERPTVLWDEEIELEFMEAVVDDGSEERVLGIAVVSHPGRGERKHPLKIGSELTIGEKGYAAIVTYSPPEEYEEHRQGVLLVEEDGVVVWANGRIAFRVREEEEEEPGTVVRNDQAQLRHGSVVMIGDTQIHIELRT